MLGDPLFFLATETSNYKFFLKTYEKLCRVIDHFSFSTYPLPREPENFPRVASILSMGLCPHTLLACHQNVLVYRFSFSVMPSREALYTALAGFEP